MDNEPNFYDIWIITESVNNPEHQLMLQSLHDLSEMKLTHWNREMLYPYDEKFLKYNELAPSLTGYARIIEFRSFAKSGDGKADPTQGDCQKQNWILSMTEGYINKGRPEGYCRVVNAFNGQTKMGYYKDGKPHGKWVCYDIYGREWQPKGLYMGQKRCIEEKDFEDFLINEEPNPVLDMDENELLSYQYENNKEWKVKKDRYDVTVNRIDPGVDGMSMPNGSLKAPNLKAPNLKAPNLKAPNLKAPKMPDLKAPKMPDVKAPKMPSVKMPTVKAPKMPTVKAPKMPDLPNARMPSVKGKVPNMNSPNMSGMNASGFGNQFPDSIGGGYAPLSKNYL